MQRCLGFGQQADYNDVSNVVAGVDQGGLGMPNRDFYLSSDDRSKQIRAKYADLLVALLKLDNVSAEDAAKDAAAVLHVETVLAQAQMDNVTRRDPSR